MVHEQKAHGTRDEGYILAQQHGLPLTKVDLDITLKLFYGNIPQEDHLSTWWQVNYIGLHHGKGSAVFSVE